MNTGGHYSARPLTPERIAKLDRSAMTTFYKARFANAADFTFFMVGAFKLDEVLPLVANTSARCRRRVPPRRRQADGRRVPAEDVREQVAKGREPRAQTILSFAAEPPLEENEQARVEAATDVLEIALRDILARSSVKPTASMWGWRSRCLSAAPAASASASVERPTDRLRWIERTLKEVQRLQAEGRRGLPTAPRRRHGARTRPQRSRKVSGRTPAVGQAPRPRPEPDPRPRAAHRRHQPRHPRDVQEVLPDGALYRGDAGSGAVKLRAPSEIFNKRS